jgi:hypothetical protein
VNIDSGCADTLQLRWSYGYATRAWITVRDRHFVTVDYLYSVHFVSALTCSHVHDSSYSARGDKYDYDISIKRKVSDILLNNFLYE